MKTNRFPYRGLIFFIMLYSCMRQSQGEEISKKADANAKAYASAIASQMAEGAAVPLSLAEAISLGLRNNRAIRSAYLQRVSQKFDLRVAERKFLPTLSIGSSYISHRTSNDATNTVVNTAEVTPAAIMTTVTGAQLALAVTNTRSDIKSQGRSSTSVLTLTLIQPLLRNAGIDVNTASVRMARINEGINLLNLKSAISQSVTQTIFSYREFLRAQAQLKIAQDALIRSRNLLTINKSLIEAGRMAQIDLIQTEADIANQELAVEEAANQIDATRLALLRLLAIDSRTVLTATDTLSAKKVFVDVYQALATAYENQPDYLSALLSMERARINLVVAKNQRLWDLSVVAGAAYSRNAASSINDFGTTQGRYKDNYAGLQLTIPLTDLAGEQGEVRATTDLQTLDLGLDELRQSIEQHVRDAARNVQTRWRQFEIAQRARNLSLKKLEAERDKFQVGRSSNFQVLSYESDLRNAENALLNTLIAYLNALTDLDQQQGKILDSWQITLND
jgi:outer membrane protein TolC